MGARMDPRLCLLDPKQTEPGQGMQSERPGVAGAEAKPGTGFWAKLSSYHPSLHRQRYVISIRRIHISKPNELQIERLRHQLSLVQKNEAFLLHAGDCAESFDACTQVRM